VKPLTEGRLRAILAWVVILLMAGPVGGAVYLGVAHGESPCILCWAQRTSMVLIALVALFVVRYGPRPRYLGMAVLLGTWGTFMALRHSALHLARDVGQGFSAPIFGLHTYVWSFIVHWTVLLVIGTLLLRMREVRAEGVREPGRVGAFAMALFVVVVAANALQAFVSTGPPPYIGQGDPIRLSLDPRHWAWSQEEATGRISLRGSWTIPRPDVAALDGAAAHGPLAGLPALPVLGWTRVGVPLDGPLSDLAYDSASRTFLAVTDRHDVLVLDSTLARVMHAVRLDPGWSIDLTPLAGAAFAGDTLAVLATNKSYVLLRADPRADAEAQWPHFLATSGGVTELQRARFTTVRARQMYVMSLAYDPAAREFVTVGVPNPRHRQLVVSRFARRDMLLASEFEPRLAEGLVPRGPDRSAAEYVVTGATVSDGTLYCISAAYSTLLAIDLGARTVRGAWTIGGLTQPVGLTVRGSQLLVAQADGRIAVVGRPAP
jgi:disulfide bond formation protein DsbB